MWTSRGTGDSDRLRVGILRDLPPSLSGGFLFSTPLFSRFPHGSPCYPRHPSAWFNYSWKSSSVLCRSAAVMFDAAKETSESQLIAISERILRPSSDIAEPSHNCLRRCSSNQTLCSHPELPTHLFPLTARLCLGRVPEDSPLSVIDGTFSAIGKDPDRNTRSDAKRKKAKRPQFGEWTTPLLSGNFLVHTYTRAIHTDMHDLPPLQGVRKGRSTSIVPLFLFQREDKSSRFHEGLLSQGR